VGAVTGRLQASRLAPWAGLFVGALAWFLHHQAGSDANYYDCRIAGGAFVVGTGLVCAVIAAAGGLISWNAADGPASEPGGNRRFARVVGMAAAAIFMLAIGFQTLAGVLVPACYR
jgi:hypothetical protein